MLVTKTQTTYSFVTFQDQSYYHNVMSLFGLHFFKNHFQPDILSKIHINSELFFIF